MKGKIQFRSPRIRNLASQPWARFWPIFILIHYLLERAGIVERLISLPDWTNCGPIDICKLLKDILIDLSTVIDGYRRGLVWKVGMIVLICIKSLVDVSSLHFIKPSRLHHLMTFAAINGKAWLDRFWVRGLWIVQVYFFICLLIVLRLMIGVHLSLRVLTLDELRSAPFLRGIYSLILSRRDPTCRVIVDLLVSYHIHVEVGAH